MKRVEHKIASLSRRFFSISHGLCQQLGLGWHIRGPNVALIDVWGARDATIEFMGR